MLQAALVLGIVATVLAVGALVLAVETYRGQRAMLMMPRSHTSRPLPSAAGPLGQRAGHDTSGDPGAEAGPVALVINPAKVTDVEALEELTRVTCRQLGLPDPLLFHTTRQEPGRSQAEEAVAQGASVVIAAGGDGTVREVARALVGTPVPMGLLPSGTGNLLARNLDLPLETGVSALLQTALSGRDFVIDVGWLRTVPVQASSEAFLAEAERVAQVVGAQPDSAPVAALDDSAEHLFLVMAGTGFDAATMADTDDKLKKRFGWFAYLVRAVRHLGARRTKLSMKVGNSAWRKYRVRTLLFANCGRLPAGIVLLPDAEIDDGYLDIAAVDTRGWIVGWFSLFWRVVFQGLGFRHTMPYDAASIEFVRGRTASTALEEAQVVQIDGDVLGEASELHVRVQEAALVVRVRS